MHADLLSKMRGLAIVEGICLMVDVARVSRT